MDIEVPKDWNSFRPNNTHLSPYDFFKEMAPLFCNVNVPFSKIGEHMQNYVRTAGLSENARRLLVGGMAAKKILLASPLLKWYLQYGLIVTHVYECIEFVPHKCFAKFENTVTTARRLGDENSNCSLLASTMKLIGNSAFGSMIMDKTRHQSIKYVQGERRACLMSNRKQFQRLTELGSNMFEVELAKRKIILNLPIQIGYWILQLAKLRMLEFYYGFLDVFCDRAKWEMVQMDTDSCYIGIAGKSLRDIIRPGRINEYDAQLKSHCQLSNVINENLWFPRTCCKKHEKFDTRTPGLFKLEFQGSHAVALCSKTYVIKCHKTQEVKFSCKGVNKTNVTNPYETMDTVLEKKRNAEVKNMGFRAKDNTIYTYTMDKIGFNYFYCKRKVLADGVSTEPLDLVLSPWEDLVFDDK